MSEHNDPLWDPRLSGDPSLRELERTLAPYSAAARGLQSLPVPAPARRNRRRRWPLALAASLLLSVTLGFLAHHYRLSWAQDRPWEVEQGTGQIAWLSPGESITTDTHTATLSVARIGSVRLAPQSTLRLLQTGPDRHRVVLESGHLRARIWAPPGYFGVRSGSAEVIDLGCEFDLWMQPDRSGRVTVHSGWIIYRLGGEERAVPAQHSLTFDSQRPGTPLRDDAHQPLRERVIQFDRLLANVATDPAELDVIAAELAALARDDDAFTMLSLLTQRPELASGPLYPRLAEALGLEGIDEHHRRRWSAGDPAVRHAWWERLPTQPKQWWRHWRDAFDQ